jgi:hypothetical protein
LTVGPLVKAEEERDYAVADLLARGRLTAGEIPHDVTVAVEVAEVVDVVFGEAAQGQAFGAQEDAHRRHEQIVARGAAGPRIRWEGEFIG